LSVKVTVYIATYNYGRFIEKAVDSVLAQTMSDWELIIINDGSTDNTMEVLERFQGYPRIRIIDQENKGLNRTNNIALRVSSGKYIVRLDADDYLDENALLILSNTLDVKKEVDLVYPDYFLIDQDGKILEMVRRKKLAEEVQLLDMPAHGACTMYRTSVLRQIGGYIENYTCQDGYEMWLRFIQKHKPYNVNIPLFYYRQHPLSLTKNQNKILDTRREIKRQFVEKNITSKPLKVLGIIPATRKSIYAKNDPLVEIAGKPLIWHTLSQLEKVRSMEMVVLSSEDDDVLEYGKEFSKVISLKREPHLAKANTRMVDLSSSILAYLRQEKRFEPDAVCVLNVNTPLRKAHHIDWAIDTMRIFDVDAVISVLEELADCYQHEKFGLTPIRSSRKGMRVERDAIYRANGAVTLCLADKLEVMDGNLDNRTVGHIVMLSQESVRINSEFEFWLAEKILASDFNQ